MSSESSVRHAATPVATLRDIEAASRTPEIEDITNAWFIHPLSRRLTLLFARLGVSPNAVSIAGMACGVLAGAAYFHYTAWWGPLLGFALMIAWHILDGSDGQLARLTHRQSHFGKVIDGICDYVTFIAVYVGLGLAMAQSIGPSVWGLLVLASVAHAMQAAAYEVQRQEYDVAVYDKRSVELPKLEDLRAQDGGLLHRLYVIYVRMQYLAAGGVTLRHERLATALAQPPQIKSRIQARYRETFAGPVRAWGLLSANYRTLGIFLAATFAVPWLYFLWEVAGLSLIMAWRVRAQHRQWLAFSRFLDELEQARGEVAVVAKTLRPARQYGDTLMTKHNGERVFPLHPGG